MNIKSMTQKIIMALVGLALAFSVMVVPISTASAKDEGPVYNIPGLGKVKKATLKRLMVSERVWFNSQYAVVRDAYQLSKAFKAFIDVEAKRGRDTTDLQTAVNAFDVEIEVARSIHSQAGSILGRNAGFNASGDVIDPQLAGATFVGARDTLRDAHFRMITAMDGLERIYKHWRTRFIRKTIQ